MEHLNKSDLQNDKDDTKASYTRRDIPFKNKITPQIHVIQAPAKALNEDRLAKKAKVIQMSRPEVPVAAQRQRL